jgi:nucleoside-diphosphate kinase
MPAERTLILLKPDCVQRRLMGAVISRFEQKGLNLIALKMLKVTPALAKEHYAEHVQKPFYPALEKFITASPIVAIVIEGLEAIRVIALYFKADELHAYAPTLTPWFKADDE